MADEWQRSAYLTNALERSDFSNKLWLADEENGNPLAAWIKWKQGIHTFDTAVFSGTYDDYLGGWKDSKTYYASWLGDFSDGSAFDLKDFWLSFYSQDSTTSEDRLGKGNDYAFALVNRLALGPWALHTSIGFGNNGPQSDPDLEGDFGGIVAMPMYWIQEDRLKLVLRYQYEGSDNPKRHPVEQPLCAVGRNEGFERGRQQWSGRRSSQLVRRIELLFLRRKPEADFRHSAR